MRLGFASTKREVREMLSNLSRFLCSLRETMELVVFLVARSVMSKSLPALLSWDRSLKNETETEKKWSREVGTAFRPLCTFTYF